MFKSSRETQQPSWWQRCRKCRWAPLLDSLSQHNFNIQSSVFTCFFFLYVPALRQNKPSFNPADTNALVGAVAFGKGLSKCRPPGPVAPGLPGQGPMMSGGPTLQQVTIGGAPGQQGALGGAVAPQQQGQPGRTAVQLGQYYAWVLSLFFYFHCIFISMLSPRIFLVSLYVYVPMKYTHWPLLLVHWCVCTSKVKSNQPITVQQQLDVLCMDPFNTTSPNQTPKWRIILRPCSDCQAKSDF